MARIKGTSIIKMLKVLQKNPAVAERLTPPELQHYFTERVLSSSWYPEEDYKFFLLALGDYPMACPEINGTITGYLRRFVELCGARDVSVQLLRTQPGKQGPTEWRVQLRAP